MQTLQACHSPNGVGPGHQFCWRRFAQHALLHIGNLTWPNLASRIQRCHVSLESTIDRRSIHSREFKKYVEGPIHKSGSHFVSRATKPSNIQERPKADMPRHHQEGTQFSVKPHQPAPGLKDHLDLETRIAGLLHRTKHWTFPGPFYGRREKLWFSTGEIIRLLCTGTVQGMLEYFISIFD